ncbi:hypothetical protein GJV26_28405 [Massilia dura]|uniref:Uncharacterized protein n=1 Tax=Pseudoduganella dura TaxID=321982 RepID=A0A6I3XV30_9BURK|nr:hypothetical protein [Pseudoduganella dura]MUI16348.1 hypothetical protein [Pseudoduganella dura]
MAAAVWAVQAWQANRAIANVESSLAGRPMAVPQAGRPAGAPAAQKAVPEEAVADAVPAAASSADRLPPLVLPGQPVPAAVLRDLPEWVAAGVAPAQTSGTSGDESAAPPAAQPVSPGRSRDLADAAPRKERQERKDRLSSVFARCPGPGQSGAVECRRAVCGGAARKAGACAPYLD